MPPLVSPAGPAAGPPSTAPPARTLLASLLFAQLFGVAAAGLWHSYVGSLLIGLALILFTIAIARRLLALQRAALETSANAHSAARAKLQSANDAAESARRAESEFLTRMSHEVRPPLNGVVGMIDALAATELSPLQARFTQLAADAADALLGMINDILDFTTIESGNTEIDCEEFDLHQLIEDLTALLTPVAAKKNVTLASFLRPGIPRRLKGDAAAVRQVLTNLVSNAIKFTPAGHVGIRAALEQEASDSSLAGPDAGALTVRIQVEDTGVGIAAERLDHLFDSFSNPDASATHRRNGSGLGLAICKRLVELMGGKIAVESREGNGARFWFTLRLLPVAQAPDARASTACEPQAIRVIAVEPDPRHRQILREQLNDWLSPPCVIVPPELAADALRRSAAEGRPFAVALISLCSQSMDGWTLAASIQSDANLGSPKLIAVMDFQDGGTHTAGLAPGFYTCLHRPLTQSRLLEAITSATTSRRPPLCAASASVIAANSLHGLHLLVAENNEMNQFVTQETLRRAGCTCDVVNDGVAAIEAATWHDYDAILMDCQMPGIDAREATRRIRALEAATPGRRAVPIIALSAQAVRGDRERCLAAGMDEYVAKPLKSHLLIAAIAAAAAKRGIEPIRAAG